MARTRTREMLDKIINVMRDIENIKNMLYNAYDEISEYEQRISTSREQAEMGHHVSSNIRTVERLTNVISDIRRHIHIEFDPALRGCESDLRQLERDYNAEHDKELCKRT